MRKLWIAPVLIFVFALACRLVDFNSTSCTYDELAAKDSGPWWNLIKRGDFTSEEWGYAKSQAVIMRWLYGVLPQALIGSDPSDPYDLVGARSVGAILGSLLSVSVYFLGRQIGGTAIGVISAIIFSLVPAILGHDRFASHDLPARIASVLCAWQLVRYMQNRRTVLWASIWAGISLACYLRVGIQTITVAELVLLLDWHYRKGGGATLKEVVKFGVLAFGIGYVAFVVTWPYAWTRPLLSLVEISSSQSKIAQAGGSVEWFFGVNAPVPFHYYFLALMATTPSLVLAAQVIGCIGTFQRFRQGKGVAVLWGLSFLPIALGSFCFRSSLNHYLLICYPGICILAAIGIHNCGKILGPVLPQKTSFAILTSIIILSEILSNLRVHPYYLDFFNILVGGTRGVCQYRTFNTGWYGEGIKPLFDFVNSNASTNSTISCRLGPWPGLNNLKRNLRSDLKIQGYDSISALGADYVLRVGLETGGEFYRWQPNSMYSKVFDVSVAGGSIGDVWKRVHSDIELVYADDFSTQQLRAYAVDSRDLSLNPFSDGKILPARPNTIGYLLFRFPSVLFGNGKVVRIESDAQSNHGTYQIFCGHNATNMQMVATATKTSGRAVSAPFERSGDCWVLLCLTTSVDWDNSHRALWKRDWVDSLYIYSTENR